MENRIQIQVIRDVVINGSGFQYARVNKKAIQETLSELKDDDQVIGLEERSGFHDVWGCDEQQHYHHWCFVVKNFRPETDDEYFERMKQKEQQKKTLEERERNEYLRLKAKFEP